MPVSLLPSVGSPSDGVSPCDQVNGDLQRDQDMQNVGEDLAPAPLDGTVVCTLEAQALFAHLGSGHECNRANGERGGNCSAPGNSAFPIRSKSLTR